MQSIPSKLFAAWLLLAALCAVPTAMGQQSRLNERYGVEGFSQPARVSKVAGKTSGVLASKDCKEGQLVQEGQPLATLERSVQEKRLALARLAMQADGDVQAAKVELELQRLRLEAIQGLAARGHATEVEQRQAEADYKASEAAVLRTEERQLQLEADYQRQLAEYEQFVVLAPFDGVVLDFEREIGEYVGPGEPHICTVAQLTTLSVEFLLPRSLRGAVTTDQEIEVLFTVENRRVMGTVSYISPFPNGETNTYVVKVLVDNREGLLSAGERCLLSIDESTETDQVIYVGR